MALLPHCGTRGACVPLFYSAISTGSVRDGPASGRSYIRIMQTEAQASITVAAANTKRKA